MIKQCIKSNSAITLIALIITIIVLLMLAGITLNMVMGDSGIFSKANTAKEKHNLADIKESFQIMLLETKTQILAEEKRNTVITDCDKLNGKENIEKIEYVEENNNKYCIVTYKNYKFKVDSEFKIIDTIDSENEQNNPSNSNKRYLLIEVKGYHELDGAVINELAIYNKNYDKIQYNILNNLEYDSVTKEKSYYWEDNSYWNYTYLNDGNIEYSSNKNGKDNCTLFLYEDGISNPNTDQYARFIIELDKEIEIGQIRFCIGGPEGRTPVKVTLYEINNFVDGINEGSTYLTNVVQENDKGLTKIAEKEFLNVVTTPTWFEFLDEQDEANYPKARYMLIEVKGYIYSEDTDNDGAVINEIEIIDKYKEKIEFSVLNDLQYDSVTKEKSFYWEDKSYWNYTNLNDNSTDYKSNKNGNKNCTLFLYEDGISNQNTDQYARFIIDLGMETKIGKFNLCTGGVEGRTPVKVSVYKINNFIDGTEEGSTYLNNVVQENDNGLTKISEKEFTEVLFEPTWFNLLP